MFINIFTSLGYFLELNPIVAAVVMVVINHIRPRSPEMATSAKPSKEHLILIIPCEIAMESLWCIDKTLKDGEISYLRLEFEVISVVEESLRFR